jgi:protein TonB
MPRLRATTALSLLALLIGIGGTGWLSDFTDDWTGPPPRSGALAVARPHHSPGHRRPHAVPRVVGAQPETAARAAPAPAPPALVPLDTPPGPSSWAQLRGHLDGRVVLDVATDGSGRVTSAGVAQSSGDPVLDAHALATVRGWRFAVPAGAPGVHGELPMRFDSGPSATPP